MGTWLKKHVFLQGQEFKLGNVIIFIYFSQIIYAYVQTIKGVQGNTGQRLPLSLSNPAPWPRTSCCYWFLRVLAEMANAFKNVYDLYISHTQVIANTYCSVIISLNEFLGDFPKLYLWDYFFEMTAYSNMVTQNNVSNSSLYSIILNTLLLQTML